MHRLNWIGALAVFAMCLAFSSCEIINPSEELPAYISFQEPRVSAPGDTAFRSNSGVRNIWLYHGGFLQGVYQLDPEVDTNGRVIPFLQLDRSDFFIEGGIYETGQSSFQIPFPFWDRVSFDWQASAGETLVVSPVFHYADESQYEMPVSVTFEGGGLDFDPFSTGLQGDSTFFKLRSDDVYRGGGSGIVEFGPGDQFFEAINSIPFRTVQSSNIFAEITYKSTVAFTVGLIYGSVNEPHKRAIVTVSPSNDWNTIYVHMVTEVRNILNANGPDTDFWLWLQADGHDGTGYIRFDDIRVIREN
jgi:hypothetical protein